MIQKSMNHFWEGLKTGKFIGKTDEDVKKFIGENHFYGEAIIEPSEEDREVIEKDLFENIKYYLNIDIYRKLSEQEVIYVENMKGLPGPHFILEESAEFKEYKKKGKILSPEDKIELFSNPDVWLNSRLLSDCLNGDLTSWGMRPLKEYGFEKDEFVGILKRVKKNTKKNLLNVLDVGGAIGIALKEIKGIDSKVITNNLTLDVEPVTYDFDNLYLCTGERFPIKLKENMDVILANMSFVYMSGQSLALENCLQSLSVGGEAFLNVEWGKQEHFIPNFAEKMKKQYSRMKKLADKGFIELDIRSGNNSYKDHVLTYNPKKDIHNRSEKFREVYFPPAFVKIKKLKYLKN
jgi:hypothetical protein